MAAGDTLLTLSPMNGCPPDATFATLDTFAGGSSPAENHPVLDFDSSTAEYMDFYCVMPRSYAGGGLTLTFMWSSDATTGNVIWSAAFKSVSDDADDLDSKAFAAYNDATADATASAAGEVAYTTLTFTDGADMDSVAAGEMFILRIRRRADQAGDTMNSNDAELHAIEIRETP